MRVSACHGKFPLLSAAPSTGDIRHRAALAQLVEHRIRNAGVTGSSPVSGTILQKRGRAGRILRFARVALDLQDNVAQMFSPQQ